MKFAGWTEDQKIVDFIHIPRYVLSLVTTLGVLLDNLFYIVIVQCVH